MILDLLRSNGSIVVNKNLVHAIGLDAAIMFSELISKQQYFADRGQLTEDGFFFNTVDNIRLDTGLGEKPQRAAIKKLEMLGVIKTDKRGLPAKRYFKVTEDEQLITGILVAGKNKKSELEKELIIKGDKKKSAKPNDINSNSQTEELDAPYGRINNTNLNNIKNNKNIYLITDNEDVIFSYYSQKYKEKFGKEHPTMNEEKLIELKNNYEQISWDVDVDEEQWKELVDYHFQYLIPTNDGNILSFLALNGGQGCVKRYAEEIYGY